MPRKSKNPRPQPKYLHTFVVQRAKGLWLIFGKLEKAHYNCLGRTIEEHLLEICSGEKWEAVAVANQQAIKYNCYFH